MIEIGDLVRFSDKWVKSYLTSLRPEIRESVMVVIDIETDYYDTHKESYARVYDQIHGYIDIDYPLDALEKIC